jgi:hypothetical protein
MKRTPILDSVVRRLNAINDLVWLQEFSLYELDQRNASLSAKARQLCTSDIFGQNPFSARINLRMERVPQFRNELTATLCQAVFSQSYELLNDYLDEVTLLLQHLGKRNWVTSNDRAPEKKFSDSWDASGYPSLQPEYIATYKYLRLRRNHYAHIAQTVSPAFSCFLNTTGAQLNAFWRDPSRIGVGTPLDFSSSTIFAPNVDESISMLRVFLLWVTFFDASIVTQLDGTKLIRQFSYSSWKKAGGTSFKKNNETVKKMAKTVQHTFKQATKGVVTLTDIEKLIWAFKA